MRTYFEKHQQISFENTLKSVMIKVYLYMAMNLFITGTVAFLMSRSESLMFAFLDTYFWMIATFIIVIIIGFSYGKAVFAFGYKAAFTLMILFSALLGVLFSAVFLVLSIDYIFSCFAITFLIFGIMSAIGYFSRKNLASVKMLICMGAIGAVLAGVMNILFMNETISFIVSIVITLLFILTVAVDTQAIKTRLFAIENENEIDKVSLYGALKLYIDFLLIYIRVLGYMAKAKPKN